MRIAEQQNVVGRDRFAGREIREAAQRSDLVALENSAIAFDGFHQGAGFALFSYAPLAVAIPAEPGLKGVDGLGTRGKIVSCDEAGVERLLALDPLEMRNDSGQRAHMLAIAGDRIARRHRSVAAARDDDPAAGAQLYGRGRSARIAQFGAPAAWALRPRRRIMPGDCRAHHVEAHNMLMQVGAEGAGDGLADLGRGEADAAAAKRSGAERRNGDAARLLAVEESLDLPIPFHPVGQASPARALARAEDGAHKRENAGRLHEHPILLLLEPSAIELLEAPVEIVANERNGEVAFALHDPDAERT